MLGTDVQAAARDHDVVALSRTELDITDREQVTAAVADAVAPGRPVTLGLRPEAVRLAASGTETATLTMEVALVEEMGPYRLVTLRRGGSQVVARLEPGSHETSGVILEGQCVDVTLEMRQSYWFDAATGAALANGRPAG